MLFCVIALYSFRDKVVDFLTPRRVPRRYKGAEVVNITDTNKKPHSGPYSQEFLDSHFNDAVIQRKDSQTGQWMNAGVIYDEAFRQRQEQNAISIKEPASYTPYIQDYVQIVKRPPVKPMPTF